MNDERIDNGNNLQQNLRIFNFFESKNKGDRNRENFYHQIVYETVYVIF